MNDDPGSYLDTVDPSSDWGLVLFAVVCVAVVIWFGLRYGDK